MRSNNMGRIICIGRGRDNQVTLIFFLLLMTVQLMMMMMMMLSYIAPVVRITMTRSMRIGGPKEKLSAIRMY